MLVRATRLVRGNRDLLHGTNASNNTIFHSFIVDNYYASTLINVGAPTASDSDGKRRRIQLLTTTR